MLWNDIFLFRIYRLLCFRFVKYICSVQCDNLRMHVVLSGVFIYRTRSQVIVGDDEAMASAGNTLILCLITHVFTEFPLCSFPHPLDPLVARGQ